MRRTLYALAAVTLIAAMSGCHLGQRQIWNGDLAGGDACGGACSGVCDGSSTVGCDRLHRGPLGGMLSWLHGLHHGPEAAEIAGPPTGQVTYPYYTLRGPRDFLVNDPPNLGP